jgi:hypothetical protein
MACPNREIAGSGSLGGSSPPAATPHRWDRHAGSVAFSAIRLKARNRFWASLRGIGRNLLPPCSAKCCARHCRSGDTARKVLHRPKHRATKPASQPAQLSCLLRTRSCDDRAFDIIATPSQFRNLGRLINDRRRRAQPDPLRPPRRLARGAAPHHRRARLSTLTVADRAPP